jgi:hypothetical protein
MTLDELAEWCQTTPIGASIRSVAWEHPVIEIVHFSGMVMLFGPVLIVNLRLLGLALRGVPVAEVADGVARWRNTGLTMLFLTGPLLLLANAMKVFGAWFFVAKMSILMVALLVQFSLHEKITHAPQGSVSAPKVRSVAVASLALWLGVAMGGMAIELF